MDQYESLSFEKVHAGLLDLLPQPGSTILDVGAGSGRDAAWFASRGYDVLAVEPSNAMRAHARELHQSTRITWIDDSLPDLVQVRRLGLSFDLILLSAVWMHLPPTFRERALRKMATLLAPNGRIAISLRSGEPDAERSMYPVSLHELSRLAQSRGLRLISATDSPDKLGRASISWTTAVFGLPDDGIGSPPPCATWSWWTRNRPRTKLPCCVSLRASPTLQRAHLTVKEESTGQAASCLWQSHKVAAGGRCCPIPADFSGAPGASRQLYEANETGPTKYG